VVGRDQVVRLKSFVKNCKRLVEEVCCTAQYDGNFLECLPPSLLLEEILKTTVMFLHDRLLRVNHQTIDGCHSGPLFYLAERARHQTPDDCGPAKNPRGTYSLSFWRFLPVGVERNNST